MVKNYKTVMSIPKLCYAHIIIFEMHNIYNYEYIQTGELGSIEHRLSVFFLWNVKNNVYVCNKLLVNRLVIYIVRLDSLLTPVR